MSDAGLSSPRFDVVALAASAGGLNALSEVLAGIPDDFPVPIVLVQHLDPNHKSLMAEILGRRTGLQVHQAADGDRVAPGGVWVAPPAHHLLINGDGTLSLTRTELVHFVRPSADLLFESMAAGFGPRSIAVVLTGTGVDGEMGVRAVKEKGGVVIAQDQESSAFFGMPGAAIRTGCVDHVVPLDQVAATLIALVTTRSCAMTAAEIETPDPEFEALLDYIQKCRSFDFTGYKRSTLIRRLVKRMQTVEIKGYINYVDYLEVHPEEFRSLFDTILINVTSFFRDPQAWDALREEVIPRMVASRRAEDPIRVWSAGCASGEESYSLAIALAEAIGPREFRDRVKIYATDVDESALAKARLAQYDSREVQGIPPELLAKYFEPVNGQLHAFQKDFRRCLIFGRHDLIQDAPISRIDLLTCRNTLMYFNSETQAKILERFHYALTDRGFLFLGKAETLMTYNSMFVPVDLKRRIFSKVPKGNQVRDRQIDQARTIGEETARQLVSHARIREVAFESSTVAQLVIEFSGLLALANEKARSMFGLEPSDLGRPFQDLQISYRPADLRSRIDRVYTERKPSKLAEVEWFPKPGEVAYLDIHVVPLLDPIAHPSAPVVTFIDATVNRRPRIRTSARLQTSHKVLDDDTGTNHE